MIERAVSISVRCSPTARAPRVVTAISDPIAASEIAMTASATSTSIRVKPRWLRLKPFRRNNLYPSGEPVDADLIADTEACQRNGAAARHARREELDGFTGEPLIAARGKQRVEHHIIGHANDAAGCARADDALRRVHFGDDLRAVADRGVAVGLEHGGGLDRKGFKP